MITDKINYLSEKIQICTTDKEIARRILKFVVTEIQLELEYMGASNRADFYENVLERLKDVKSI